MDRRKLVAGNWKMHTTSGEGAILVDRIADRVRDDWEDVEVAVCPPFTGLHAVSTAIEVDGLNIALGAQDVFWEAEGAFTGAIAPRMLADLRCTYVIVGHSERREHFGETDETVNLKVKAVLRAGMVPIVCVGETLATREAGETDGFVRGQVMRGVAGLDAADAACLVVAYEPIWAIGTGRTPTPEAANDVARGIRATIGAMYGPPAAIRVRVLYGGSVKAENARMFFGEPDIDGALVGGASLDAESFAGIVRAAAGR